MLTPPNKVEEPSDQLRQMCLDIQSAVLAATKALLEANLEQANQAISFGSEIALESGRCEHAAVTMLATQAQSVCDLRQVTSAVQLVGDLARMGALSAHIANVARRRHPYSAVPESVRPVLHRMGETAAAIATSAVEVLQTKDPVAAAHIEGQDDAMDGLYRHLLDKIQTSNWDGGVSAARDLALVARYYERFADHAVQVGRRTISLATESDHRVQRHAATSTPRAARNRAVVRV
ncbi:phosphate signaling complex PhoU family protein [Smaragdicoccus niigatensis]|uniref:phosphate signaling complex PhoU family protein n=1 Tax=Smaragdicoccus niigatensis TaxID=359359 RepID=UPI0003796C2F|nr:PhoU domain-containing protein [Smaragdicoccus niigatensis]